MPGCGHGPTAAHAAEAVAAGAEFLVTPGTTEPAAAVLDGSAVVLSGALTPTEVMAALACGVHVVKLFRGSLGGPAYLKALRGRSPTILRADRWRGPDNVPAWLDAGAFCLQAGGASWCPATPPEEDDSRPGGGLRRRRRSPHVSRPCDSPGLRGGVSTAGSSIMTLSRAGPSTWGLPTRGSRPRPALAAPAPDYRALMSAIKDDPAHRGALVTTHKLAVFAAAATASTTRRPGDAVRGHLGDLQAWTTDCSARRPTRSPWAGRWASSCRRAGSRGPAARRSAWGSGGRGGAQHALGLRDDPPERIIFTALDRGPAGPLRRRLHERTGIARRRFRYHVTPRPADVAALVAALPPSRLVVNATGLGKDRPGSPVGDDAKLPRPR